MTVLGTYTENGSILRADGASIPPDPASPDFRRLLAAEKDGKGTIAPFVPPAPADVDRMDGESLNAVLAQEGSVVRALALVLLGEINALRKKAGMPEHTRAQFVASLKARMRG